MEPESALIAEQISHTVDLLRSDLRRLEAENAHQKEKYEQQIRALEEEVKDHEARLRLVQESSTQFKFLAGLATGGGLISIITLIKTLNGL